MPYAERLQALGNGDLSTGVYLPTIDVADKLCACGLLPN